MNSTPSWDLRLQNGMHGHLQAHWTSLCLSQSLLRGKESGATFFLKKNSGLNFRDFFKLSKRKRQSCEVYQSFWKFLTRNCSSILLFPREFLESMVECLVSVGISTISGLSIYFPGNFRTYHSSLLEVFGFFWLNGNAPWSRALDFLSVNRQEHFLVLCICIIDNRAFSIGWLAFSL